MKIAVIIGSPRKKDSFNICHEIENQIKQYNEDIEFDYIILRDYHIDDCKGCMMCFQKSEDLCPCKDDLNYLKGRLFSADGFIVATPVYAYQVTAALKRFIDRMSYLFHRQELVSKPALIVVTTDGGGGSRQVYKYLKMTLSGWGLDIIGNVQIISPVYFENREPKGAFGYDEYYYSQKTKRQQKLSKEFYNSLFVQNKRVPTFYDIFMFNCLRSKTYTSKADREYWQQKGWLDADYFYNVKMNFVKKIFGRTMRGLIHLLGARYLEK